MVKKKILLSNVIVLLLIAFGVTPLLSWETPMVVAGKAGFNYYKPEIGFAPSGAVYITYREKDLASGDSDIILCHYDGKEMTYYNVSESATFYPRYKAYESDVEVTADGVVHMAWVDHDRSNTGIHYVKYRNLNGNTWSQIYTLGQLIMHGTDAAFDLRLGVDSSGNVHVVTYKEEETTVWYFAKYGDIILPPDQLDSPAARIKHPDIAVDDNYIHVIWMRKIGFPYVIVYQKWENKIGAAKSEIKQITFPKGDYASQKSRIDVDSQGYLHLAEFYKTGVVKKLKYYKEMPNGSFSSAVNVSHPTELMLYHWAGLEVRDNSIIVTMQLGSSSGGIGLFYNWKKNGDWGGYDDIPGTDGAVHQSVDLSADGEIAAVTYGMRDTAIMLASTAPITASGALDTEFTYPSQAFWGSDISFDASQCAGLNPDHSIASYEWNFGDGSIETTTSPTITHQFGTYGSTVKVMLTITATTGEKGVASKDIYINALYNAIITSLTSKRVRTLFYDRPAYEIQWSPNQMNVTAGYPTITGYEIWRAPMSTSLTDDNYAKVGEVSAGITKFLDYFGVQANVQYVYSVRSVDAEGHISPFNHISNESSIDVINKSTITDKRGSL